ncbi:MAG: DUF2809 domain-containing protein [Lentisphaeraceae bacterium]|nr:DUF2809 domain-containing protein [Lentisphaeraceae bacterium]
MKRHRGLYFLFIVAIIPIGLFSRHEMASGWPLFHTYGGDTLYSALIFLLLAFCFNKTSTTKIALAALLVSWSVEALQLYQAPWIQSIRANRLGGLILGFGFLWSDIVCYTVGVVLCSISDKVVSSENRVQANSIS